MSNQNWQDEAAASENDEVVRFEAPRRRTNDWAGVLKPASHYANKKMEFTAAELVFETDSDLDLVEPRGFAVRQLSEAAA